MKAKLSDIEDRHREYSAEVAHRGQFKLANARSVDCDLVLDPNWSLYCLDVQAEKALFAELPDGTDLAAAPFAYSRQFECALRVAEVDFGLLAGLASQAPPTKNLALLVSTGRCGSTLASRIFAKTPDVWSLSEPDWMTNLAFSRSQLKPGLLDELIPACTKLTCRPPTSATDVVVVKPRSEVMVHFEHYAREIPDMRSVFMYRDAPSYVNSLIQFSKRIVKSDEVPVGGEFWQALWYYGSINSPPELKDKYFAGHQPEGFEIAAMGWALRIRAYLAAVENGVRVNPLHYEDLNSDRRVQTKSLLNGCGIGDEHIDMALQAFDRDSQAGAGVGDNEFSASPLDDSQRERVSELVHSWGLSDYVLDRMPLVG